MDFLRSRFFTQLHHRADSVRARTTQSYGRHRTIWIAGAAIVALLLRLAATPFGLPIDPDVLYYLLKAREIADGDLAPVRFQSIGWALALTPIVVVMRDAPWLAIMDVVRVITCVLGALIVVATAGVAREMAIGEAEPLAVYMTAFSLLLVRMSVRGFVEPLLTLLFLMMVAEVLAGRRHGIRLITAGACAGLASWLHPTALWLIVVAVCVALASHEGPRRWRVATTVGVVSLVFALPAFVNRMLTFSGPLDYGRNSPPVRLGLILSGTRNLLYDFCVDVVHLPVVPFLIAGVWLSVRARRLQPAVVTVAVFLLPWFVLYGTWGTARYLTPILPFVFVLVAEALVAIGRLKRYHGAALMMIALAVYGVAYTAAAAVQRSRAVHDIDLDGMEWARWIAEHAKGRVVMGYGQHLVVMHMTDVRIGGLADGTIVFPTAGLTLVDFPRFEPDMLGWMRRDGVTHIVLDHVNALDPEMVQLRDTRPPFLVERFSTYGSPTRWPIRLFEIRWADAPVR